MRKNILRSVATITLFGTTVAASTILLIQQRGDATSPVVGQSQEKPLREMAKERDVVRESFTLPQFSTFDELIKLPRAVVYGRITRAESFFGASDHPLEDGDYITTEYTVEVYKVLKNTKLNTPLDPGQPEPVPLVTPLKISRNGGVVHINGRRAEVKAKGYEFLKEGQDYVFFLSWDKHYKSYSLAGDISGVVIVNADQSLTPLASSEEIRERLQGADLESLAAEISRRN